VSVLTQERPPVWTGVHRVEAPTGAGRRVRAQRRRLLGDLWCERGVPCLVGDPTAGTGHLVVEWPGGDARFLELVAAATEAWELAPIVLGTAGPGTARALGPDVVESSGAAALARALGRRLGRAADWDVVAARHPVAAILAHVRADRPGLVTVPHAPHRHGRACRALDLAVRLDVPVLLA
jgi:hypothetical protein